jgi:hypothetical protein
VFSISEAVPSLDILTEDKPTPICRMNQQKLPQEDSHFSDPERTTIQTRKVINISVQVWQLI